MATAVVAVRPIVAIQIFEFARQLSRKEAEPRRPTVATFVRIRLKVAQLIAALRDGERL